MFEFNKPIVDEYKRWYGADITQFDDIKVLAHENGFAYGTIYEGRELDVELWHRLKGEYLTLLLKEAKEMLRKKNRDLWSIPAPGMG